MPKGNNFYTMCNSIASTLFEYDTNKVVHIKCKKIGFVNRLIQLLIIGYVIGYAIVYKKGYQKFDEGLSSVTIKVKGIAYTNLSLHFRIKNKNKTLVYNQGPRAWDSADYVTPAEERDAVFIMTNMMFTPEQKQGKCPEYNVMKARCKRDSDCVPGRTLRKSHGVMTGKCVSADRPNGGHKMCEVYAWCPVEYHKPPMQGTNFGKPISKKTCLFEEAINFTIAIKNTVRFPEFDEAVRNIDGKHIDHKYLKECEYDNDNDNERARLCPIFRVKTIFKQIRGIRFKHVAIQGGVIAIKISWDCNFDYDPSQCVPHYSFYRLEDASAKVAPGYSIRIVQYDEKLERRTLIKAYGIRFVVLVDAKAGKFNIVPLLRNFGAGLALLGLATILCDICVLYFMKQRARYRRNKYHYVDPKQAEIESADGILQMNKVKSRSSC